MIYALKKKYCFINEPEMWVPRGTGGAQPPNFRKFLFSQQNLYFYEKKKIVRWKNNVLHPHHF